MIDLYDGKISDLLQNAGRYNPEIQALSYAILAEKRRLMDEVRRTRLMAMLDEVPEKILDVLAVELRTPAYSEDLSIDVKRNLIRGTFLFYAKLGTPQAVNWAVRTVFGNGGMEDWYDYGGTPHHFRVTVHNDGTFGSMARIKDFHRLVQSVKRLSSWLDEIIILTESEGCAHIGVTSERSLRYDAWPLLVNDLASDGTLRVGGPAECRVKLEIYPLQNQTEV